MAMMATMTGMASGRPTVPLVLSDEESRLLRQWSRRPKTAQALAVRSRIVLACAAGKSNQATAAELGVTRQTVGKWRARFARLRLDGLLDEPRPGAPRKISDEKVEEVVRKTLEERPADATHWSTRSLAQALGLSQSAVSRIWRASACNHTGRDLQAVQRSPLHRSVRELEASITAWLKTGTTTRVPSSDGSQARPGATTQAQFTTTSSRFAHIHHPLSSTCGAWAGGPLFKGCRVGGPRFT
jgi:transposase